MLSFEERKERSKSIESDEKRKDKVGFVLVEKRERVGYRSLL